MLGILITPAISRFRTDYAPQVYYLWYNAAIVCILPWLAILWKDLGFNGGQIGILAGLRPFIAALSGQTLVGFADAHQLHFVITVTTYIVTFLCRGGMGVFASFIGHVMLILFSEACQAPFSIMSDAAAAAASKDEGDYGMRKLWASVGWGVVAPLSGWVVQRWGVSRSIAIYFSLVLASFIPLVLLPIERLSTKRRRSQSGAPEAQGSPAGAAAATKLGVREPLLSAAEERRHGGKAAELAIELQNRRGALKLAELVTLLVKGLLVPFFPSPWLVLPLEILQGLTFGVVYCAGTINCKRIAPLHLRSTTQLRACCAAGWPAGAPQSQAGAFEMSMLFCLYYGFGPSVSGLAGGYIYQAKGMRSVFITFGIVILLGWLATLLLLRCFAGPERCASSRPQAGGLTEQVPSFAQAAPSGADGATAVSTASAAGLASASQILCVRS